MFIGLIFCHAEILRVNQDIIVHLRIPVQLPEMLPLSGITRGPKYDICVQPTPPIGFYKSLGPQVHLPADCSFVTRPLHLPDLTTCPISNVMRYVVSLAGKIR